MWKSVWYFAFAPRIQFEIMVSPPRSTWFGSFGAFFLLTLSVRTIYFSYLIGLRVCEMFATFLIFNVIRTIFRLRSSPSEETFSSSLLFFLLKISKDLYQRGNGQRKRTDDDLLLRIDLSGLSVIQTFCMQHTGETALCVPNRRNKFYSILLILCTRLASQAMDD